MAKQNIEISIVRSSAAEYLTYVAAHGGQENSIEVRYEDENIWLSQKQMAELFQKDQSVIARHISNVFSEGELPECSNMQILHNTLSKYKPTKIYNLDVIELERDITCAKFAHAKNYGRREG